MKNMTKFFSIISLLCVLCLLSAGCSKEETPAPAADSDAGLVQEEPSASPAADENSGVSRDGAEIAEDTGSGSEQSDAVAQDDTGTAAQEKTPDVDLTTLSSTMVFAEVFNIMTNPEYYMGKTIRMSGPYSPDYFEGTGKYYHYVVIQDATACCKEGLEFIWNGDHSYPEDYPKEQTEVEVTGVLNTYDEGGQPYYYLAVDDILIL